MKPKLLKPSRFDRHIFMPRQSSGPVGRNYGVGSLSSDLPVAVRLSA